MTKREEERRAVVRVLKLLDGYLSDMPDMLHCWRGGLMTVSELRQHARAALKLSILKPAKRNH